MRSALYLSLLGSSIAFVLPDERTFNQLSLHDTVKNVEESVVQAVEETRSVLDRAFESATTVIDDSLRSIHSAYVNDWIIGGQVSDQAENDGNVELQASGDEELSFHPPHHHHPHHPQHGSNKTVYQLISESKYTTKLTKLIDEYDDIVDVLNGTAANYTVFAPTDKAFEKIPKHGHHKPSKEFLKDVLLYHVSPEFHPAPEILAAHTIPSLYREVELGLQAPPQRLSVQLSLKGVTVNYYVRVIAPNIYGSNGVIHGVDSLIFPPPKVLTIIDLLPGEFSTLELGLTKTGLYNYLQDAPHKGSTFFAPTNFAFQKLGPKINAFLFSKYGQKYLAALLKYHVVLDQTLYSNAFYDSDHSEAKNKGHGLYHVDLPTLLENRHLGIDIAKFGPITEIKINGFVRVSIADGIAKDGVIHLISDVLIPPKKLDKVNGEAFDLSVEELVERLEPFTFEEAPEL